MDNKMNMKEILDGMTDHKKLVLYKFLLNEEILSCIKQTRGSKNSYSFKSETDLFEYFGLNDSYKACYQSCTNGQGHEENKIKTIHSSALLAFLFFANRESIKIEGIEYDQIHFEVESKVFDRPSCIDVLLVSKDKTSLLYLECKFSEYFLSSGKCNNISKKYLTTEGSISETLYNKIKRESSYLTYSEKDNEYFSLERKRKSDSNDLKHYYCAGIKQLISHLVGIQNGFDIKGKSNKGTKEETKEEREKRERLDGLQKIWENATNLKLGTVIFDFKQAQNIDSSYFGNYKKLYNQLCKFVKKEGISAKNKKGTTIEMIDLLTYQTLPQEGVLPKVLKFYHLNQDKPEGGKSQES
jgi:hypothetical protein